MKKILVLVLVVWVGILASCSNRTDDVAGGTATAGTYTVKATIEEGGVLYGGTIYIDTEIQGESRDYSVFTDAHVASMVGKTEWEGRYSIKKSIKVQINARSTKESSVLTVYLLKDGKEVKKDVRRGVGAADGLVASVSIIL